MTSPAERDRAGRAAPRHPDRVALAIGAGGPEGSVVVLGPLVTFSLPLVVMVAFWWEDWPGTRLGPNWSGWVDTVLIAAGGVALTCRSGASGGSIHAACSTRRRSRPRADVPRDHAAGRAAFVAMLQLTLVGEGGPLRAAVAGRLALLLAWPSGSS